MAIVNLKEILANTRRDHYAVGSFNFNGFEDVKGMILGAAELHSPIIVMASPSTTKYVGLHTVCAMVRGLTQDAGIPVALHLDHCTNPDFVRSCVEAGFTSVMIDASARPFEENIAVSREIVEFAHARGCSVEAELGIIGGHEEDAADGEILYTNPLDAEEFVNRTGVDALAIAVGTIHGFYKSEPNIDFDRIAAVRSLIQVPIVLHGGTGVSDADFQHAITCGISKINVGTELKYAYSDTLKRAVQQLGDEHDPRKFMGMVTAECAQIVKRKIGVFGSGGHAEL